MGRASDAPVVASAGTQAEPRTPASWLLFADRSQTAAPLPVGSDPRSVRRTEPFHKAPLPSSPALGRYAKGLPCCRNFTPAQPDRPAASMRDFCSGAYRMVERRIKEARFPTVKSLDSFEFAAIPSLNKTLVLELARCEYVARRENVIAVGNSGTGKTHIALGLGLAACQKGLSVGFVTAAALVHELIEARDEKRLLRLQRQLAGYKLLIIDELGYVPLSTTGAELLFEVFSQRYERGSTIVTSNLPFDEWTGVFGSERLTGALLDRLTHHVHILEMNGDSYRLKQSKRRQRQPQAAEPERHPNSGLIPK